MLAMVLGLNSLFPGFICEQASDLFVSPMFKGALGLWYQGDYENDTTLMHMRQGFWFKEALVPYCILPGCGETS